MTEMSSIILAGGKGTRMKSRKAKVLFELGGRPLIQYSLALAKKMACDTTVVVVGHQKDAVEAAIADTAVAGTTTAFQKEQLGTGHAVMVGMKKLTTRTTPVLIMSGDVPLLKAKTINQLKKQFTASGNVLAFVGFSPMDAGKYGRIVFDDGHPVAIREYKDCSPAERRLTMVNAGIYLVDGAFLAKQIGTLKRSNAQGEFYLTDLVAAAAASGRVGLVTASPEEVAGVNDRADLAVLEQIVCRDINAKLMKNGVTLERPDTIRVEQGCRVGQDTYLGTGVQLLGNTRIGMDCTIEPGVIIRDCQIGNGTIVKAYSVLESSTVGPLCEVGPMGRLRPGSVMKKGARVGNFVELKKTILGEGSKANHLSYLGDGIIGRDVNLGAGCIFCNYDGFLKHEVIIEDGVFVGSDSQIVAPATIGRGAYVASGTTVTRDVQPGDLAISRGRQQNKKHYGTLLKQRLKAKKATLKARK